MYCK